MKMPYDMFLAISCSTVNITLTNIFPSLISSTVIFLSIILASLLSVFLNDSCNFSVDSLTVLSLSKFTIFPFFSKYVILLKNLFFYSILS